MAIIAKATGGGKDFIPAPEGTHAAVCVDVIDLGMLEVTFGGKKKQQHKVNIVWQIDETRPDGKLFTVRKRYTLSLHEKAALRKDLESWRGQSFKPSELEGFDLEVLIGKGALVNVLHEVKEATTYANVVGVMRLPSKMAAPSPRDYVRVYDRPNTTPPSEDVPPPAEDEYYSAGITDDDVPF